EQDRRDRRSGALLPKRPGELVPGEHSVSVDEALQQRVVVPGEHIDDVVDRPRGSEVARGTGGIPRPEVRHPGEHDEITLEFAGDLVDEIGFPRAYAVDLVD